MTLRVVNWDEHYETAESKRIKHLLWVATPNGHDSVGFKRLLKHPNGMAHYGAWNLILQTASKCSPRGLLMFGRVGHRESHNAETIADVTGGSEKIIADAIPRLLEIGWLEEVTADAQQSPADAQQTAGQATSTGQGGQYRTLPPPPAAAAPGPVYETPFDDSPAVTKALSVQTFMEWKNKYRAHLGFNPDRGASSADWASIFNQHGWDDMCAAADYLIKGLKPGNRLFPDMFAKLAKD